MTSQVDQQNQAIAITDTMAEAGRKILADQFNKLKEHEDGSRTGEDIESVHQMRVATRRMRSLFKLLGMYYKPKPVTKYNRSLKDIARALGQIRDLDVMILDLQEYSSTLAPGLQIIMEAIIENYGKQRHKHRIMLNALFDSKQYAKFIRKFSKFTVKPGRSAIPIVDEETPYQVRHVLPVILHERLAAVRAYDNVLDGAGEETLHALRVEFKRLRYAVEFFTPVLGASIDGFIKEMKAMQDLLGRMNDIVVFTERVKHIKRLTDEQQEIIEQYQATRQQELDNLRSHFDEQWQAFNRRTVQKQFADALLVLR